MTIECKNLRDNSYEHVVLVCCHGIWTGGPTYGEDESEWLLAPFQAGETSTFREHIRAGLRIVQSDEKAMIVFSGGATKPNITNLSEGQSYYNLAIWLAPDMGPRMRSECLATDSFQNLLFSLLLFQNEVGKAPKRISIVSHAFKQRRFIEQHCPMLQLPASLVEYVGIDPDKDLEGRRMIEAGEAIARAQWEQDPWGWGLDLGHKRWQRGWTDESATKLSVPDLVRWDGGPTSKEPFPGILPWKTLAR